MEDTKTILCLDILCSAVFLFILEEAHLEVVIHQSSFFNQFFLLGFSISGALAFGKFTSRCVYMIGDNVISFFKK